MARAVALIASSRKGSWMTLSALQGHPSVLRSPEQWFSHPEFMKLEPRVAVRQLYDARTKVDSIVHSQYPLPYSSYLTNKEFYAYLCASDATFVFLHRRNMIRWYVSIPAGQARAEVELPRAAPRRCAADRCGLHHVPAQNVRCRRAGLRRCA
jgi:hypothetical protein